MFLKECKYVVKEKKIPKYIIDNIEISSDSDRENSDEEHSDEENSCEKNFSEEKILMNKILMKKIKQYFFITFFFVFLKMVNKYYQKRKERLRKKARERYKNLSEEEKDKRWKKVREGTKFLLKNVSRSYLSIEEIII